MRDVRTTETLKQWKRAVVHLECITSSTSSYEIADRVHGILRAQDSGEITPGEAEKRLAGLVWKGHDVRYHGTAIYVRHAEKRYLITARHVLLDELGAAHFLAADFKRIEEWAQNYPEQGRADYVTRSRQMAEESAKEWLFHLIVRVPTLDDRLNQPAEDLGKVPKSFKGLMAGCQPWKPYKLSEPQLDLAVIALDGDYRCQQVVAELEQGGYEPISSDAIASAPSQEGVEVMTVGFPGATSRVGRIVRTEAELAWSSDELSLPTFSFGRVAMMHSHLPYFWCDMSVYPGGSGGPVIEGDKLVGIVSGQATMSDDSERAAETRIPFAKAIRAQHIIPLLDWQLQIDRENEADLANRGIARSFPDREAPSSDSPSVEKANEPN